MSKKCLSKPKKAPCKPHYTYEAKTENQKKYLEEIDKNVITISTGPAGSGKSLGAVAKALEYLFKKNDNGGCRQIILTRPAIEAGGEHLGSLPGDIKEKFNPYVFPLFDNLLQLISKADLDRLIADEKIKIFPMAYLRGVSLRRSFVILDEAQNTKPSQILCLLTRIDENSKVVITGDKKQTDIRGINGLEDAIKRLSNINGVGVIKFGLDDIMRHPIIRDIILAYDKEILD